MRGLGGHNPPQDGALGGTIRHKMGPAFKHIPRALIPVSYSGAATKYHPFESQRAFLSL